MGGAMDGAKGSALEWALALHRTPAQRHVLRNKPLPAGLETLLGIAGGSMPEALAQAARAFGESEAAVREAAQFYVREVLFFPQATAYRVLGVAANASADQIKTHHRLLQHWLHPDRLHGEDDAIFATRVNSAWNRLRNPERRQAYDQALQQDRPPEVFDSNGLPRSVHAWVASPPPRQDRWRQRAPMLILPVACLVLMLVVMRDMARNPETADWTEVGTANTGAAGSVGISVPHAAPSRLHPSPAIARANQASREPAHRSAISRSPPPRFDALVSPGEISVAQPVGTPQPALESQAAPQRRVASIGLQPQTSPRPSETSIAETAPPKPSAVVAGTATPDFARSQLARRTGDQFLRYMSVAGLPPPPVWNSPAIQSSADQLRQALHAQGRPTLGAAHWRIGNETAVLTSGYTMQGNGEINSNGLVTADLLWRNGQWLVTGLSVERAQ